ncbi:uncharacterized protein TNCV_2161 [Trichonephila clavipes]|nr:uncharacterized protein TNCV_2161 [Trichonephila clavipes]
MSYILNCTLCFSVSLDPRPVVIPILSSVIGFPIVVFALICALRHRAIKLRRRDQLKKLQSGCPIPYPSPRADSNSSSLQAPLRLREAGTQLAGVISTQESYKPPVFEQFSFRVPILTVQFTRSFTCSPSIQAFHISDSACRSA